MVSKWWGATWAYVLLAATIAGIGALSIPAVSELATAPIPSSAPFLPGRCGTAALLTGHAKLTARRVTVYTNSLLQLNLCDRHLTLTLMGSELRGVGPAVSVTGFIGGKPELLWYGSVPADAPRVVQLVESGPVILSYTNDAHEGSADRNLSVTW